MSIFLGTGHRQFAERRTPNAAEEKTFKLKSSLSTPGAVGMCGGAWVGGEGDEFHHKERLRDLN